MPVRMAGRISSSLQTWEDKCEAASVCASSCILPEIARGHAPCPIESGQAFLDRSASEAGFSLLFCMLTLRAVSIYASGRFRRYGAYFPRPDRRHLRVEHAYLRLLAVPGRITVSDCQCCQLSSRSWGIPTSTANSRHWFFTYRQKLHPTALQT